MGLRQNSKHVGVFRFKKNLKIYSSPVATYYTVMANLTNCHTCYYGGQTSSYFECMLPKIEEYLV